MDRFQHHKEGENKCRYDIGRKKSCADCLFDALCLFERNQEKLRKNYNRQKKDLEENIKK